MDSIVQRFEHWPFVREKQKMIENETSKLVKTSCVSS